MRRLAAPILAGLLLASCARSSPPEPPPGRPQAILFEAGKAAPVRLNVRIADSPAERAAGLMGVTHLRENEGMAFVFDQPDSGSFWMKGTVIPLSIAFIDEANRIVAIRDMQPCSDDPCPKYDAGEPYALAVEANLGFFRRSHIHVGDTARLVKTGRD